MTKAKIGEIDNLLKANSSSIIGFKWDDLGNGDGNLILQFPSGYYRYLSVPIEVFNGLYHAESKGKHFAQHIKHKFQFEKIETSSGASTNKPRPWVKYPEDNYDDYLEWTAEEEAAFLKILDEDEVQDK